MRARLSFQNLNAFATAAQVSSFQGAAEILHVTPSAVSHQIRSLESALGYPLFERLDKRIELTDRGNRLFMEIREPLRQIHQASRDALRGPEDNALALSVAPVFATRWLLPRLKDFRSRYPEINLSVIATTSLVDFRSDPFDAVIRMGGGNWPDTLSRRLFGQRFVAVCRPDLIEANGGIFTADQVAGRVLIHNSSMGGLWEEWFSSAGIGFSAVSIGVEVQDSAQVLEAINAEDAIGLVDLSFFSADIEAGHLALACDHTLIGEGGYYLAYPESARERPALLAFGQWLVSQIDAD